VQSRESLDILGLLSKQRNTFSFQEPLVNKSETTTKIETKYDIGRNIISHQKQIIPTQTINEIEDRMDIIKRNGWLSTNPDSVDGLPSLHLNLITGGKPLFDTTNVDDDNNDNTHDDDNTDENSSTSSSLSSSSFEQTISSLISLLNPYLYDLLLPTVRELCDSSTVEISDVFIRNYGRNVIPDEGQQQQQQMEDNTSNTNEIVGDEHDDGDDNDDNDENVLNNSRFGLSPHYDVFTSATCVIALDSTASTGKNGLYTIHRRPNPDNNESNKSNNSKSNSNPNTIFASSHAALKQFFPLEKGDGVVHSFDILHGVDVDPSLGQSRTSLIIWFVDNAEAANNNNNNKDGKDNLQQGNQEDDQDGIIIDQPWLLHPSQNDHVKQFILALASECKVDSSQSGSGSSSSSNKNEIHELYIKSAQEGNVFALNSLAEMCDDGLLSEDELNKTRAILFFKCKSSSHHRNPFIDFLSTASTTTIRIEEDSTMEDRRNIARALWFESSMLGNRVAQANLADSIMDEYMSECHGDYDYDHDNDHDHDAHHEAMLLMASTFFCMSAQQGYDVAREALSRIVQVEYSRLLQSKQRIILENEEVFMLQPVVQTVLVSS